MSWSQISPEAAYFYTRTRTYEQVLESERKRCIARIDDLCSAVRLDCEKARDELATEIAATLQVRV